MRGHVPRSKTRINLNSNKVNNDGKDDDDNDDNNDDNNSSSDNEDGGGGDDDDNNGGNNFLFTGKNAINSCLPLSQFTSETVFSHCTQDEDHRCKGAGLSLRAIRKEEK